MIRAAFVTMLAPLMLIGCAGPQAMDANKSASIPLPPAPAPAGYKWVLNDEYSDEFNGAELDKTKWNDHFPGWQGRVPGLFVPEAISVDDGYLQIRSHVLDEPRGENGEWWIGCGAVQSKEEGAFYGYYETRVKASSVATSTTFWLKNKWQNNERPFKSTELDIQECIGNAQTWPGFAHQFRINTHIEYIPETPLANREDRPHFKKGDSHNIGSNVDADFHTYGCWWADPKTVLFYLDGELVMTIDPTNEIDDRPFDRKMFLNMVCEIYDWEVTPTREELADNSKNTTYYDWVRSWKLVKAEG